MLKPRALLAGAAAVLGVVLLVVILVQADVFDWVGQQAKGRGYLSSYLLLYIEETGIPLPAPGDLFMLYTGAHTPHTLPWLLAAWAGFVVVVVAGASNLYWIARRLGRDVAHTRLARIVHLTPERLQRGEAWFRRYGLLAIIFGRHVVGFRIPITVACGVLHVPYPVFIFGVTLSTAVWAGFWVGLGAVYGLRAEDVINAHRWIYWVVGGALVAGFAAYIGHRWWVTR